MYAELLPLAYEIGSDFDTLFYDDEDIFFAQVKGYYERLQKASATTSLAINSVLLRYMPSAIALAVSGKGKEAYYKSIPEFKFSGETTDTKPQIKSVEDMEKDYRERSNSFI